MAVSKKGGSSSQRLPLLTEMSSQDLSHLEALEQPGIHPHHISLELGAAAKDALGTSAKVSSLCVHTEGAPSRP